MTLPKGWWYTAADARLHVTSSKQKNFLSVWSVWMSVNFPHFITRITATTQITRKYYYPKRDFPTCSELLKITGVLNNFTYGNVV